MFQDRGCQFNSEQTQKFRSICDVRRRNPVNLGAELCLAEEAAAHRQGVFHAPAAVTILEIWREGFLLEICQLLTWKRRIWKTCSAHTGR